MRPAAQRMSFKEDMPVLFLAWLAPSALLVFVSAQQVWTGNLFTAEILPEIPPLRGPLSMSAGTQAIVGYVWPQVLLLTLIVGIACQSLQAIGKQGMLVALTYCAVSLPVLAHLAPGSIAPATFQLMLLISLLGFCLYSREVPELAVGAGLCAAAMLATGLEMAPFVLAVTIWCGAEWAAFSGDRGEFHRQKTLCFGYSFGFGTILLGLFAHAGWNAVPPACGPLSMAHIVPATLVGFGLAHLANNTLGSSGIKHRLICLGGLATAAACSIVATNPSCVTVVQLGSIIETMLSWGQGLDEGLLTLFAADPRAAYTISATPLIGLLAACYAATTGQQPRSAWALLLGCLAAAVTMMAFDTNFAIFANALAIVPCALLTVLVGRFSRTAWPRPLVGAVFVLTWLSGMHVFQGFLGVHVAP